MWEVKLFSNLVWVIYWTLGILIGKVQIIVIYNNNIIHYYYYTNTDIKPI